jgi:hypothetical protein
MANFSKTNVYDLFWALYLHTHINIHKTTYIYIHIHQCHGCIAVYTFFSDLLRGVGDSVGSKGRPCDISGCMNEYYTLEFTHTYIYIYIYVCVYACIYICTYIHI